jgi:hypothetical protein
VCADYVGVKQPVNKVTREQSTYNWSEENCYQYYRLTGDILLSMHGVLCASEAICCMDPICSDNCHLAILESFTKDIISTLVNCSRHCIHYVRKRNNVPWSSALSELKRCSVRAHREWVIDGKPHFGDIWQLKVNAHNKYKQAIKCAKSKAKSIFSEKLLSNLLANNTKNF